MKYRIFLTPMAQKMLEDIKDLRIQRKVSETIGTLNHEPEKLGKPLTGELSGFYSIRAAGQKYRIIYQVQESKVIVNVVAIGIRKEKDRSDIYSLARKLIRLLKPIK